MGRRPTFVAASTLTFAIAFGSLGAVYVVSDNALLRPLGGIQRPKELVQIKMLDDRGGAWSVAPLTVERLTETNALAALAGYAPRTFHLSSVDIPSIAAAGSVISPEYFRTLGVSAELGRLFSPTELDLRVDPRVLVISHHLWTRLARDSAVVGRRVRLNGLDYMIVGVAGQNFRGVNRLRPEDVWVPSGSASALAGQQQPSAATSEIYRALIGRVRPDIGTQAAQTILRLRFSELAREIPRLRRAHVPTIVGTLGLEPADREALERAIMILSVIAVLVVLAACANLSNLFLLHFVARRHEFHVRRALGASARRLLQQCLCESALVGVAGALLGSAFAVALSRLIAAGRLGGTIVLDAMTVRWEAVAVLLGGWVLLVVLLAFLIWMAAMATIAIRSALASGAHTLASFNPLRKTLTVVQVAASLALVAGAMLLGRTVWGLQSITAGFQPRSVYSYLVNPAQNGYDREAQRRLQGMLRQELSVQPGIRAVALTSSLPLNERYYAHGAIRLRGTAEESGVPGMLLQVSPGYFSTLRIPVVQGRTFSDDTPGRGDSTAKPEIILSQTAARLLFPDKSALGREITCCWQGNDRWTIVGIVADSKMRYLRERTEPLMYLPLHANAVEGRQRFVIVRSDLSEPATHTLVDRAMQRLAPDVPVQQRSSLERSVQDQIAEDRWLAWLMAILATIAVILAALGVYAVVSYGVTQRTREIGIRIALGSSASGIAVILARQSARLVIAGVTWGFIASLILARVLQSRLYGVGVLDTVSNVTAVSIVLFIAAVACAIPLGRAASIDPVEALRRDH